MLEEGLDFKDAFRQVAAFYQMEGAKNYAGPAADYDKWPALPGEAEGEMKVTNREFLITDLKPIYASGAWKALYNDETNKKTPEAIEDERFKRAKAKAQYLHFKAVDFYTRTSAGVTHKFTSNSDYPILSIHEGDFTKIYSPRAKKEHRFFSIGERPTDLWHGLEQLDKFVKQKRKEEAPNDPAYSGGQQAAKESLYKVEEVFIMSGGSDSMNCHAIFDHVVWPNSETAPLTPKLYKQLKALAWNIYICYDIDDTGLEKTHELCMQYLGLKAVRLPMWLLTKKDRRGDKCKDLKDYFEHATAFDYKNLVKAAVPYRFWQSEDKVDKDGEPVMKFGEPVKIHALNNVRAYNFLFWNGYCRYPSPSAKAGYVFIKIDKHVVAESNPNEAKDFIHKFLEERYLEEDLRNMAFNSPRLNEASMSNLPMRELDFKPYGKEFQYKFFRKWNATKGKYDTVAWRITENGILEEKNSNGKYVWEEKVLEGRPKVMAPFFKISKEANAENYRSVELYPEYTIPIPKNAPKDAVEQKGINPPSIILNFLVQTCRVHWRAELEDRLGICSRLRTKTERLEYSEKNQLDQATFDIIFNPKNTEGSDFVTEYRAKYKFALNGPLLTEAEQLEQMQHFVSRIYYLGYMQHRYKTPSKPWAGYVMDNKISGEGESFGGSGKSLIMILLEKSGMKLEILNGKDSKLMANPHMLENVDDSTDAIIIDDITEFFRFEDWFPMITGTMTINPKNNKSFKIKPEDSPKVMFTSNFGDKETGPSALRRKIYTALCDYYHENNGDYRESRKPIDEFGQDFFVDWPDDEYERFHNMMAQCLTFYLGENKKIEPPMGNVQKRNMISEMTEAFKVWADMYFENKLDTWVEKHEAYENYQKETGAKQCKPFAFKKRLQVYAKFMNYDFNPREAGTAIRKSVVYLPGGIEKETSNEHVYLASKPMPKDGTPEQTEYTDQFTPNNNPDEKTNF